MGTVSEVIIHCPDFLNSEKQFPGQDRLGQLSFMAAAYLSLVYIYTGSERIRIEIQGELTDAPLFQSEITINPQTSFAQILDQIKPIHPLAVDEHTFQLTCGLGLILELSSEHGQITEGIIRVQPDEFIHVEPRYIPGHFSALLNQVNSDSSKPIDHFCIVSSEERERMVVDWNQTAVENPFSGMTIPEVFSWQAEHEPNRLAVCTENDALTYAELDAASNRLAQQLSSVGITAGDRAGVWMERSVEAVISFLAVLKCGAAFIPLDPGLPKERIAQIQSDCQAKIFLVDGDKPLPIDDVQVFPVELAILRADQDEITHFSPAASIDPEFVCFILYTSGSTGKPKGVIHTHRNILNRYCTLEKVTPFKAGNTFAQLSPFTTIDAVDEVLFPILFGGSTAIISNQNVRNPHALVHSMCNMQVTHILLVPSLLKLILEEVEDVHPLEKLSQWIVGGEILPVSLANEFHTRLPGATLINFYGLTEGDGTCFYSREAQAPGFAYGSVSIGKPAPNIQVYLLNSGLQPVPVGVVGEIFIGGLGIAQGYLNLPDLTRERFLPNPFVNVPGSVLFRTGDLGRYLPDGNIVYLGRMDQQVKIRGFRVELEEVEQSLGQCPGVKEGAVVAFHPESQTTGSDVLLAFVVLKPGQILSESALRAQLATRLPEFAVPSLFAQVDVLPLNANGKVDRRALLAEYRRKQHSQQPRQVTAPRNELEADLVKMWEEILAVSPVGIDDSFFNLGGTSLTGIQFLSRINKKYGKDLPVDIFLKTTTISGFEEILVGDEKVDEWSALAPIQPSGSQPPFFMVHAEGGVIFYRRFAQALGSDFPVYGLQAQGMDGKMKPLKTVEEMAAQYIQAMKTIQPHGPYSLGAFSLGGVFLFEMIRQLAEAGEEVNLAAFIDAGSPDYPKFPSRKAYLKHKVSVHIITLGLKDFYGRVKYLKHRISHRLRVWIYPSVGKVFQKLGLTVPHGVRYVLVRQSLYAAVDHYHPGIYPGNITLFRAQIQPKGCIEDPYMGWKPYITGEIEVIEIEGNHDTIMLGNCLQKVANELKKRIQRGTSDPSQSRSMVWIPDVSGRSAVEEPPAALEISAPK